MNKINSKAYFGFWGGVACFVILIALLFSTEFVTSFSQNLVKTTGAVYLCLVLIYSFILLYRFMKKTKLILTLKEILLTIVFLFSVYDVALFADKILQVLAKSHFENLIKESIRSRFSKQFILSDYVKVFNNL